MVEFVRNNIVTSEKISCILEFCCTTQVLEDKLVLAAVGDANEAVLRSLQSSRKRKACRMRRSSGSI